MLQVFEKALDEPKYSSMYAQMCLRLSEEAPNFDDPGKSGNSVRHLSNIRCSSWAGLKTSVSIHECSLFTVILVSIYCRLSVVCFSNSARRNLTTDPRLVRVSYNHSKTSFEKNCFSAWASTLNIGLINKVDMVRLSPVGYGV